MTLTKKLSNNYTYTDKKRFRKDFGNHVDVVGIPYLISMQKDSYYDFLQKDIAPNKRKNTGIAGITSTIGRNAVYGSGKADNKKLISMVY